MASSTLPDGRPPVAASQSLSPSARCSSPSSDRRSEFSPEVDLALNAEVRQESSIAVSSPEADHVLGPEECKDYDDVQLPPARDYSGVVLHVGPTQEESPAGRSVEGEPRKAQVRMLLIMAGDVYWLVPVIVIVFGHVLVVVFLALATKNVWTSLDGIIGGWC